MLDIQLLRHDVNAVAARLAARGFQLDTALFEHLETRRKSLQVRTEELQAQRNSHSKQIGALKGQGKHDEAAAAMAAVAQIKADLEQTEHDYQSVQQQLDDLLLAVPNLPHTSVPVGSDESQNVELRRVGSPREFDFAVKDHVDIGAALGLDFETGAQLSGARFH